MSATSNAGLFAGPALQHLEHFHVVWIRRIVVLGYLVIGLRRLENQRDIIAAPILHQPLEGRLADVSFPYENVTIPVRSELGSAVIQMKKRGCLSDHLLELIEYVGERLSGGSDVVAGAEEVTGIESVSRSRAQLLGHFVENVSNLLSGLAHRFPRACCILHE